MEEIKPFLRWAGGKFRLVNTLVKYAPKEVITYYEPFLGGGSLFFKIHHQQKSILSDLNPSLIQCYKGIQESPQKVYESLKKILRYHSESNYYKYRDYFNNHKASNSEKSAMFIYLNKTCFNGIYRVNKQNHFNVPYGKIIIPAIPTINELLKISDKLKGVELHCQNYDEILNDVKDGDFVYLDPPYPPLNDTAKFVEYTKEKFTFNDQERVAIFANKLDGIGCKVMISNANTPFIQELFNNWNIHVTSVKRTISCKKERYSVEELIITNY